MGGNNMLKNFREVTNEKNMLDGNINRMCVTKDIEELENMFVFAEKRVQRIYQYNLNRLKINESEAEK